MKIKESVKLGFGPKTCHPGYMVFSPSTFVSTSDRTLSIEYTCLKAVTWTVGLGSFVPASRDSSYLRVCTVLSLFSIN